jgi:hypothetical protein
MSNNGNYNTVTANQVTANKIVIGNWAISAKSDGLYVTTPDGVVTKMELIDFRQTPVPETAKLALQQTETSVTTTPPSAQNPQQ